MDVVASLLSKFQPIADSLVLHQMLHKIAARYLVKKVADNTVDAKKENNVLRRAVSSDTRHRFVCLYIYLIQPEYITY